MSITLNDDNQIAIIFKKDGNSYSFHSAALIKYISFSNIFTVLTGQYAGTHNDSYNILTGDPKFIYCETDLVSTKINESNKKLMIYIFPNQFIELKKKELECDNESVLVGVIKDSSNIQLIIDDSLESNTLTKFRARKIAAKVPLSDKKIVSMLENNPIESNLGMRNSFIVIGQPYDRYSLMLSQKESEQLESKFNFENVNIPELITKISNKIVGQDDAIKTLVTNIYFNQMLINSLIGHSLEDSISELDSRKVAILLDGTTGTGKTAICKEISTRFKLPMVIVNANSFSETGYVGPSITEILSDLLKQANGNMELAQRGIIFLDEIDKIADNDIENRHSMKLGVQDELLGFMSGAKYDIESRGKSIFSSEPPQKFDTSKLTFILSGAFTSIKDKKINESTKKLLGFGTDYEDNKEKSYTMNSEDYIEYGLKKEFFGRIKVITSTKTYSKEDLQNILLNSEISPIKGFEKNCIMFGYSGITYDMEVIEKLSEEAYDMETGARALQSLVAGMQDVMLYSLITKEYDISKPVPLTVGLLEKYKERTIRKY